MSDDRYFATAIWRTEKGEYARSVHAPTRPELDERVRELRARYGHERLLAVDVWEIILDGDRKIRRELNAYGPPEGT